MPPANMSSLRPAMSRGERTGFEARRDNGAPLPRVILSRIMVHQPACGS